MQTCEVRIAVRSEERCGDPASHRVTAGCKHEHIVTLNLCAEDWEEYQRFDEHSPVICYACELAGTEQPVKFLEVIDLSAESLS